MTYRGYTIKQKADGSYSVFIDNVEDMEDLPSEDAAKAFIDGKFDAPDVMDTLKQYAPKVKHLTRNQVDNYVYYNPYDTLIDTDNIYMLAYKTKKDRISGVAKAKKAGFKLVDTTDNDEGRLPYWAFVMSPETMRESKEITEDTTEPDADKDVYDYFAYLNKSFKVYPDASSRSKLIDLIIKIVTGDYRIMGLTDYPEPGDEYWNIYAAAISDEISTQYSYNIVYKAIDEILDGVFMPIIRQSVNDELDPMDAIKEAIEENSDVQSELAWVNDLVSDYGDALEDILRSAGD